MGDEALKLADDPQSYCLLADPKKGQVQATLHELSAQGALLGGGLSFSDNDYVDCTLHLKGVVPRPMFAHVVSLQDDKVLVRWLHFEGADEAKLKDLLVRFRDGSLTAEERIETSGAHKAIAAESAEAIKEGTRRIVRPSTVFTPFAAKGPAKPGVPPAAPAPVPAAKAEGDATVRKGTRRITRPSQPKLEAAAPAVEAAPPATPPGEGSGSRQVLTDASGPAPTIGDESASRPVVIAPTARFEKLADTKPKVDNPVSTENPGKAKVVVGSDGKMDIGATIRSKAKTVRASELAARHENVRVLNMGTIKLLIQDAVSEAMQHLTANMGEAEKKQLLQEAEEKFQERLKAFKAEKESADAYAKHLNDQLRKAQELLETERKREIKAEQFTVSDAGMGQIEDKMKRVLDHAMRTGNVSPELEAKLREMIAHILDDERERIRRQEEEAQSAKIDLLEKKIKRLAKDLDDTERERDEARELANALEAAGGGGIASIMKAGIKDNDGNKKRKLSLMKEILDMNRKIREELGVTYQRDDEAVKRLDAEREKLPDGPPPESAEQRAEREAAEAAAKEAAIAAAEASGGEYVPAAAEGDADADADGEEAVGEGAYDDMVDPDDMTWEVQEIKVMSDEERDAKKAGGGVKKISAGTAAPPPMFKKPGGGYARRPAHHGPIEPDPFHPDHNPTQPASFQERPWLTTTTPSISASTSVRAAPPSPAPTACARRCGRTSATPRITSRARSWAVAMSSTARRRLRTAWP